MEQALAEGLSNARANSMLAFVIRFRNSAYVDARYVEPGHWLYERIRAEVLREMGAECEEESVGEERN
jgi:hypothetical protein